MNWIDSGAKSKETTVASCRFMPTFSHCHVVLASLYQLLHEHLLLPERGKFETLIAPVQRHRD
jgi:hypothetical protein